MKINKLQVGDFLFFHTEPKNTFDRIIPFGIQELTNSLWNHVETIYEVQDNDVLSAGALSEGYKIRSIREAISKEDVRISVRRYHGDGVGGKELTDEDKFKIHHQINLIQNAPYGFSQIAFLAVLSQINNVTLPSYILRQAMEELQKMLDCGQTQMICSEAAYRVVARAGLPIRILNDDAVQDYYNATGSIMDLYRATKKEDQLNPLIENWITPKDLSLSPDLITMGDLEVGWR
jgi:hypothetical protein